MLVSLIALAAALPAPLTAAEAGDVRCVALLAIVANEQKRGSGWTTRAAVGDDGARFSGVVGEALVRGGRTREAVRDMMVAAVAAWQKGGELPATEVDRCAAFARTRAPAPPPPTLPRCAALMAYARDASKSDGSPAGEVRDRTIVASVLDNRAREALTAQGRSEAEADIVIGRERESIVKAATIDPQEFDACARLAAPPEQTVSPH